MQNTERKGTAFYDERKIRVVVCSSVKGHCKGAGAEKYFYIEKSQLVERMLEEDAERRSCEGRSGKSSEGRTGREDRRDWER